MSNNANGSGKGATKSISPEKHAENREAAKKRKQTRHGKGKGMHAQTLAESRAESQAILAENALAERLELHLSDAIDLAHASLSSMTTATRAKTVMKEGKRTVVTKKEGNVTVVVTKPAFDENIVSGMTALLDLFFVDSAENRELVEAYPVSKRVQAIVHAHFAFACETYSLGDAFRKDHPWYNQVASGKTLADQVKTYKRQLRAAELAAKRAAQSAA